MLQSHYVNLGTTEIHVYDELTAAPPRRHGLEIGNQAIDQRIGTDKFIRHRWRLQRAWPGDRGRGGC